MRIILLISSLNSGGAERVATTLCNAWAERGDIVTLIPTFSGGGTPFYKISGSVNLVYLTDVVGSKNKNIFNYLHRFVALRQLIKSNEPDVVISFLPNVNVVAILSTTLLKVPLIISERRDPAHCRCSPFWELACQLTYRFSDMLVIQTESVAKKIGSIYPGIKKISTIANPVPPDIVLQRSENTTDRKVLLSLGRLSAEKQVSQIINQFSKLHRQFPDWDLHIYGNGPLKGCLEEKINELGLTNRIFMKGLTTQPWVIMSQSDLFIMTSMFEGFPNALLEAMGVGMACIVYDCPSGPYEITRGGIDASLVTLNDQNALQEAMRKNMSDDHYRSSLGKKARKSIRQRYLLPVVLDMWDKAFREVGVSV